jgi:hypothetical protein
VSIVPLLLGLLGSVSGCNSDQLLAVESESESSTGDATKTPATSLSMTTYNEPDLPPEPTNLISCRDIVECLGTCKLFPTDEIDQECVLTCVGVEGVTLPELLWGLDLATCAADQCAQEPNGPGDTDEGEMKCNPDETLGIDLSEACLACVILKTTSTEPVEGCEEQFALCDDDPNNDASPAPTNTAR